MRAATRETGRIEPHPTTHRLSVPIPPRRLWLLAALLVLLTVSRPRKRCRRRLIIDHVTDGDTVVLRNGQHVRLVQIDTPEVYFGVECYGNRRRQQRSGSFRRGPCAAASNQRPTAWTVTEGSCATHSREDGPTSSSLGCVGAPPVLLTGTQRNGSQTTLQVLAKRARAKHLGLWGACPRTRYDPYKGMRRAGSNVRAGS